jgi:hypothetical protein
MSAYSLRPPAPGLILTYRYQKNIFPSIENELVKIIPYFHDLIDEL